MREIENFHKLDNVVAFSACMTTFTDDLVDPLPCCVCVCRHAVLDEADQMLERGFADSVEEILAASFNEGNVYTMHMCFCPDFD